MSERPCPRGCQCWSCLVANYYQPPAETEREPVSPEEFHALTTTTFGLCGNHCEHDFQGWRNFEDGSGGEQVCTKCGTGAMHASAWEDGE